MHKALVDDMFNGKESKYALVVGVAKRAKEISDGFREEGLITEEKPILLAIEDFKEHKYDLYEPDDE